MESFRCQPSFHIFTLVTNGAGLCLLHRFKGKASSCQVNIQIREMLKFFGGDEEFFRSECVRTFKLKY